MSVGKLAFAGVAILTWAAAAQAKHGHHASSSQEGVKEHGPAHTWSEYRDPVSGTAIEYPSDLFSVEAGPPHKGSGHMFRTSDGRSQLTVYALSNDAQETPAAFLDNHL